MSSTLTFGSRTSYGHCYMRRLATSENARVCPLSIRNGVALRYGIMIAHLEWNRNSKLNIIRQRLSVSASRQEGEESEMKRFGVAPLCGEIATTRG